jgi:hypothetical protein
MSDEKKQDIKYAFITFRDMQGMETVKKAYSMGVIERWLKTSCFGSCCCESDKKRIERLKFKGKWLKVVEACDPDNIKWQNLGYSGKYRRTMSCLVWLIAVVLILISLIGIVIFKEQTDRLEKKFASDVICPANSTEMKSEAY